MYYKATPESNDIYNIIIINFPNFTLNYKVMVENLARYMDTCWLSFNGGMLAYRFRHSYGPLHIFGWGSGIEKYSFNTGKQLTINICYNFTITKKENIYKWYLNGNCLYQCEIPNKLYQINMIHGWTGSPYDNNYNGIFGDIFFADECLVDGNFTIDNTKLFMNELGPVTTLESDNKIYGMK